MTIPIWSSWLVRLVCLLPFRLLRSSLATRWRWTPLALSVLPHCFVFFFSSRRRHTRLQGDWSSDVCSSDLHFVQMDLFGGDSMHPALGFADQPERADGTLLHPIGQRAALDQPHQLADVAPVGLGRDRELDLLRSHAAPTGVPDGDADARQTEACRELLEPGSGGAEGQERAQGHIAADAG